MCALDIVTIPEKNIINHGQQPYNTDGHTGIHWLLIKIVIKMPQSNANGQAPQGHKPQPSKDMI